MNSKVVPAVVAFLVSVAFNLNVQALTLDNFDGVQSIEVSSSTPFNTSTYQSSALIGGFRTIEDTFIAGPFKVSCEVSGGFLSFSEDALTSGNALITWDGQTGAAPFDPAGLGGVDLTQDQSDAFLLKIASFDYPSQQITSLRLTIYDAVDPTGTVFSEGTVDLQKVYSGNEPPITIPYSSLITTGSGGAANFHHVGAITLAVEGTNASDVTLDFLNTNGSCNLVPGPLPVVDVCNVCGGDGKSCLDCAGVPFGKSVEDVCTICGGDGKSCLDCAGTPFGKSVIDSCGVCGGNGSSCNCKVVSQAVPTSSVLKTAKVLVSRTSRFAKSAKSCTHKNYSSYVTSASNLYLSITSLLGTAYPATTLSCANSVCTKTSQTTIIAELRTLGKRLGTVAKNSKLNAGKVCPSRSNGPDAPGTKKSDDYTNDLLTSIKKLPTTRTQCD